MKDDELIDQMKAGVMPRIRDLMSRRHKEALDSPEFAQMCADAGEAVPEPLNLPLDEESWAEVQSVLNSHGSLTTIAVGLLWAVAAMADEGVFVSNEVSVAVAVTCVDVKSLVPETGMSEDDISFVLQQMAESLKEVILAHTSIMVLIDESTIDLRAE